MTIRSRPLTNCENQQIWCLNQQMYETPARQVIRTYILIRIKHTAVNSNTPWFYVGTMSNFRTKFRKFLSPKTFRLEVAFSSRNCNRIFDPHVWKVSKIPYKKIFFAKEGDKVQRYKVDFRVGNFRTLDMIPYRWGISHSHRIHTEQAVRGVSTLTDAGLNWAIWRTRTSANTTPLS